MKILVTNDDGLQAEGIAVLASQLRGVGDVYVVAPASEQSGVGHGLTARNPLRAIQTPMPAITEQAWAVTGTPADCVKLGIEQILGFLPDLVVSGINHGPNLATDTIYSGTVAGAMEGFLYGIPAIAISVVGSHRRLHRPGNFLLAAQVAAAYGVKLYESRENMLLNINVPGSPEEGVKGIRFCPLGWRWYKDAFDKRVDPFGREYFWMQGVAEDRRIHGDTDVELCGEGYITITPLRHDLTDYTALEKITAEHLFSDVQFPEQQQQGPVE